MVVGFGTTVKGFTEEEKKMEKVKICVENSNKDKFLMVEVMVEPH